MKEFFNENFKAMVWLAALIALLVIFFSLRKKKKDEQEPATDDLQVDPTQTTISENEAIVISENLLAAMNRYGTDERAVLENLEGLNQNDLLLVIKKFGSKPYNGAGLATRGYEIALFAQNLNLIGWLRRELDGSTLSAVQEMFNANGITL